MKKSVTLLLYIVFIAGYLVCSTVHFAYDRITMPPQQSIGLENFEVMDMKQLDEKTFVSVSNDPYFSLIDGDMFEIHTVKYTLAQPVGGAKGLYYTTKKQPMYSGKNMIIAKDDGSGTVEYILPMGENRRVRLDICGELAQTITVEEIVINYRPAFTDYFRITAMGFVKFMVLPPFIASIILFIRDLFLHYVKKQDA